MKEHAGVDGDRKHDVELFKCRERNASGTEWRGSPEGAQMEVTLAGEDSVQ